MVLSRESWYCFPSASQNGSEMTLIPKRQRTNLWGAGMRLRLHYMQGPSKWARTGSCQKPKVKSKLCTFEHFPAFAVPNWKIISFQPHHHSSRRAQSSQLLYAHDQSHCNQEAVANSIVFNLCLFDAIDCCQPLNRHFDTPLRVTPELDADTNTSPTDWLRYTLQHAEVPPRVYCTVRRHTDTPTPTIDVHNGFFGYRLGQADRG